MCITTSKKIFSLTHLVLSQTPSHGSGYKYWYSVPLHNWWGPHMSENSLQQMENKTQVLLNKILICNSIQMGFWKLWAEWQLQKAAFVKSFWTGGLFRITVTRQKWHMTISDSQSLKQSYDWVCINYINIFFINVVL